MAAFGVLIWYHVSLNFSYEEIMQKLPMQFARFPRKVSVDSHLLLHLRSLLHPESGGNRLRLRRLHQLATEG